jgi:hypothetical protein
MGNITIHLNGSTRHGENGQLGVVGEEQGIGDGVVEIDIVNESSVVHFDGVFGALLQIIKIELTLIQVLELSFKAKTVA